MLSLIIGVLVGVAATTTTAAANACEGPLCGGGSGGDDSDNPAPNPGTGNGGGTNTPPGYFSSTDYFYDSLKSPPVTECLGACGRAKRTGVTRHYRDRCLGSNKWGAWDGLETSEAGTLSMKNGKPVFRYDVADYDCISAAAYTETDIKCAYNYNVKIVGPIENPTVSKETIVDKETDVTNFARNGMKNIDACENSMTVNINKTFKSYGKYRMAVKPQYLHCTLIKYYKIDRRTKRVPNNRIGNCSEPTPDTQIYKAQLFCETPGWSDDWEGEHDFTTTDCLAYPERGIWNCGPQTTRTPTRGNVSGRITMRDDGVGRPLRWKAIVPAGAVRSIADKQVQLRYVGGTPFRRDAAGAADASQPFVVNPTIDDWVFGWAGMGRGKNTDFVVNFQAASTPQNPWTAAPQWKFTGEFHTTQIKIESINTATRKLDVVAGKKWKRLPAACTGAVAQVHVYGVRNTS